MAYELHVARTRRWLKAASAPITKTDVDELIASDAELSWSTSDFVEMEEDGENVRYYMIVWRGESCFWWHKDQITCSHPSEGQQLKLVRIAQALGAYAVGDDDERYELRKGFFGKEKLVTIAGGA
jgi:hypothetical protein